MTDESFKFFFDQVIRQYQELKADIRNETVRVADELKDYKVCVEERFERIETQLDELKQFRWTMAGAAAFAFGVAEVAIRALDWWLELKK